MRKPLIAGNWKMNTNIPQAISLVQSMLPHLDSIQGVDKVICPPFISLSAIKLLINNTSVQLGAQNMYFKEKGAYTGEISPNMLTDLCEYVIIGHSERRQYFAETDEMMIFFDKYIGRSARIAEIRTVSGIFILILGNEVDGYPQILGITGF